MKTTIEMNGYEITISESEEGIVTVQAMKDGEVVEEFELEGGEDTEMMPFGNEEEEDLGTEEEEMGEEEEELGEEEEELGEEEEELGEEEEELGEEEEEMGEEESKLESFSSFVRKRR